jgi:PAS domain-containing protein
MRIGILGSGLIGGKLGTILARAGHDVVFSYSRSRQKLQELAADAGASARTGTPAEAVADADAVVLAVHWTRVDDVLAQTGKLSGRAVLTCSLPRSSMPPASQMRGNPVQDEKGCVLKWYGTNTDLEDRARAEDALRLSADGLRMIVDTIPGLVAIMTAQGELELVNHRLVTVVHSAAKASLGRL